MLDSYVGHQFISNSLFRKMEFQAKFKFNLLVLIVLCYNPFELVYGKPAVDELEPLNIALDNGEASNNSTRVARDLYHQCVERWGCHKGYCWAGCEAILAFVPKAEWCYTTKGSSQDFKYVPCYGDGDCGQCWDCAGSCTV